MHDSVPAIFSAWLEILRKRIMTPSNLSPLLVISARSRRVAEAVPLLVCPPSLAYISRTLTHISVARGIPDVKLRVGLESGPTTTPGCWLFNDCCSCNTSLSSRLSDPPLTLPSSSSSRPGSSARNSRFFWIHSRT